MNYWLYSFLLDEELITFEAEQISLNTMNKWIMKTEGNMYSLQIYRHNGDRIYL